MGNMLHFGKGLSEACIRYIAARDEKDVSSFLWWSCTVTWSCHSKQIVKTAELRQNDIPRMPIRPKRPTTHQLYHVDAKFTLSSRSTHEQMQ